MRKPWSGRPSRRNWFRTAAGGLGFGVMASGSPAMGPAGAPPRKRAQRLPREVWVATISQDGLRARNWGEMSRLMLARMEEAAPLGPDIVCLPEVFPFVNLAGGRPPLAEVAERPIGPVCRPFAGFARKHHCYVVCGTYTRDAGHYYNAAVFIDRSGELLGEYRKLHPTVGEMKRGVTPGPLEVPVFRTDFGTVGAQICFDIEWRDGWRKLAAAGAEIVFWPSAFAGGIAVNTKAWQHRYVVVASTRKDTSKICDISGAELARTSRWNHWACAPVNLEKAFLHTWPYVERFPEIHRKYGRKVRLTTFPEEEWSILESRSPEVKVAEVMKEFGIDSYEGLIRTATAAQNARRP